MSEPSIDDVESALAICRRADEIYELMFSRRFPKLSRDQEIPFQISQTMRIQSLVIALIESRPR